MEMTGKNKENFEGWLESDFEKVVYDFFDVELYLNHPNAFKDLPDSMQWGVYLEYYDSIGIDIGAHLFYVQEKDDMEGFCYWANTPNEASSFDDIEIDGVKKTRQEAQDAALKKANEIANEKL